MAKERFDIHQHITTQIITAIEQGAGDFQLPWRQGGHVSRPTNISSKRAYRGVNILALWAASHACGYSSGVWGTYRQWAEAGAQVRKGEKSSYVVFYKELEFAQDDGTDPETRLFARATPVFAAEQVDGLPIEPVSDRQEIERIATVEAFPAKPPLRLHPHSRRRARVQDEPQPRGRDDQGLRRYTHQLARHRNRNPVEP